MTLCLYAEKGHVSCANFSCPFHENARAPRYLLKKRGNIPFRSELVLPQPSHDPTLVPISIAGNVRWCGPAPASPTSLELLANTSHDNLQLQQSGASPPPTAAGMIVVQLLSRHPTSSSRMSTIPHHPQTASSSDVGEWTFRKIVEVAINASEMMATIFLHIQVPAHRNP